MVNCAIMFRAEDNDRHASVFVLVETLAKPALPPLLVLSPGDQTAGVELAGEANRSYRA